MRCWNQRSRVWLQIGLQFCTRFAVENRINLPVHEDRIVRKRPRNRLRRCVGPTRASEIRLPASVVTTDAVCEVIWPASVDVTEADWRPLVGS